MKITVVGANSYIARNLIFEIKQRKIKADLKLYDYADSQTDGEQNYQKIDILDRDSVSKIDFDCDIIYMFVGKTGTINIYIISQSKSISLWVKQEPLRGLGTMKNS